MTKYLVLLVATVIIFSCKSENKSSDQTTTEQSQTVSDTSGQANAVQAPGTVNIPAGPDGIVHHYVCADKCKGGHSETAGNCPVCGKALAHNQEWHNQAQNQTPQQPAQQTSAGPRVQTAPGQTASPAPTQAAPETVNIPAGSDGIVHHYICSAGCKGGHSENAGNCPKCSKPLAHNQAWHNK